MKNIFCHLFPFNKAKTQMAVYGEQIPRLMKSFNICIFFIFFCECRKENLGYHLSTSKIQDSDYVCSRWKEIVGLYSHEQMINFSLKNISYDFIEIYLYKTICDNIYMTRSGHIDNYLLEDSLMILKSSDMVFLPYRDTVIRIEKGMAMSFIMPIRKHINVQKGEIYYLNFVADSSGISKVLNISYKTFDLPSSE